MQKKLFKTSLLGFSKTDVCEYIASMNAEFNEKIAVINAEYAEEKLALTEQISALVAQVERYKQASGDVAQALFDAQQYAGDLKAKSDNEYAMAANELMALKEAETQRLRGYRDKIEVARQEIVSLLNGIDGVLTKQVEKTEDLMAEYNSEEGMTV